MGVKMVAPKPGIVMTLESFTKNLLGKQQTAGFSLEVLVLVQVEKVKETSDVIEWTQEMELALSCISS